MINVKSERLLGLARHAGKCTLGAGATETALRRGICHLVLIAENSGSSTKEKFINLCKKFDVKYIFCNDKFRLGKAVGLTEKSVVGLTDKGFADGIYDCEMNMEVSDYGKN